MVCLRCLSRSAERVVYWMSSSAGAASDNRGFAVWEKFEGHVLDIRADCTFTTIYTRLISSLTFAYCAHTVPRLLSIMVSRFGNALTMVVFQINLAEVSIIPSARVICPTAVTDALSGQSSLRNGGL